MNKLFRSLCIIVLCSIMALPAGCTAVKTQVVYSVYPIGYLLERLAGKTLRYQSIQEPLIVERAQILDDYEDTLSQSQAYFHLGDLEPYLSVTASDVRASGVKVIDLSTMNAIYDFKRYMEVPGKDELEFEELPYYEGDMFSTIDTTEQDLHLWVDPIAMLSMGKDIEKWLVETYPDNKGLYEKHLNTLESDMINLDAQYQNFSSQLSQKGNTIRFATMTAGFGNWQKTYGFQVYPIIMSKYGVLPNDEQLKAIEERLKQDNVQYIVYEPNMTDDMKVLFRKVQSDLDLKRIDLSNLSSLTEDQEEDGKDYLSLMYENLSILQTLEAVPITNKNTSMEEVQQAE